MDAKRKFPLSVSPEKWDPHKKARMTSEEEEEESMEKKQSGDLVGKICLICHCSPDLDEDGFCSYGDKGPLSHCLLLLDLDSETTVDGYVPRNPNLCFDTVDLGLTGFCVMGSTLYLFGHERKDLFSYDLSSIPIIASSSRPLNLSSEESLTDVKCPMRFSKRDPVGCRTPDGKKMLVLSSLIDIQHEDSGKFELFDPMKQEWTVLPDLLPLLRRYRVPINWQMPCHRDGYFCILSYSFVDNGSVLLIVTTAGNFTLNMEQVESNSWAYSDKYSFPPFDRPRFMLVRDGLCLTDWSPRVDHQWLSYPELLMPSNRYLYPISGGGLTWLSSPDRICVARSHVDEWTRKAHLIIDVCGFDSDVFQREKNNLSSADGRPWPVVPGVKLMKRFKFVLGPQAEPWLFYPQCLFPIP